MRLPNKKPFIPLLVGLSLLLIILTGFKTIPINSRNYAKAEIQYFVEYTVKQGDTLWLIATKVRPDQDPRKTIYEIEKENGIGPVIKSGMVLRVPVEVE